MLLNILLLIRRTGLHWHKIGTCGGELGMTLPCSGLKRADIIKIHDIAHVEFALRHLSYVLAKVGFIIWFCQGPH